MKSRSLPCARACACVLFLALFTASASTAQQRRPMTMVDMINIATLSDPQLSLDGTQLLYVLTAVDWDQNQSISHIWRVNADGTGTVRLTNGEDGESSPRWSPEGNRIAFLARRGEDEQTQIYLLDNRGGEAWALTEHPTSVSRVAWAPNGRSIYFVAPDEKTEQQKKRDEAKDDVFRYDEDYQQEHLWRMSPDGGDPERLTEGDFSVSDYHLSRDGTQLTSHRRPAPVWDNGKGEVWLANADGSSARQLTNNSVPERGAQLSPDNSQVLFTGFFNEEFEFYYNDKIFLVPASGGTPRQFIPALQHQVSGAAWSANGRSVFFLGNTGVRQQLFKADVGSGEITQLTRGDHTIRAWDYLPALRRHVLTISTPTNAGDVWTLDEEPGAEPARITHVFDHLENEFLLPRQEVVQWKGEDGVTVEGLIFYPADYRQGERYPLVVQTHGGPTSSDKFSFPRSRTYVPVLTAMGYMVFKPNYRGSTGYGDGFMRNMIGHYFDQAHKDVMTGVDYLIERELVDGTRMAKMGWSAGGHMTNKIITYTGRFKAASSGAGAANWISMYAQSDVQNYRTPWFGGTPWEKDAPIDRFWDNSPLKDVHRVTTPTLVLVGEGDPRVPMPQSVELFKALRYHGVPTHLYVAPREGHGWRELRHQLFKANVELDWFERWVRNREYTWEEAPEVKTEKKAKVTTS